METNQNSVDAITSDPSRQRNPNHPQMVSCRATGHAASSAKSSLRMRTHHYLSTRLPTLAPTFDKTPDPFTLLVSLSGKAWVNFLVGLLAWTLDALDFHTVTQTYPQLQETFERSTTDISVSVTLSLALRPIGAAAFGLASDMLGRKWPLIWNLILLSILELSTSFCRTYDQFLAVRALFGIAMGGIYGNASATALEDCPEASRGLMSGIYQSGYPFGYLLAIIFWKAFDDGTSSDWRPLFWLGAGIPVLLIIWRLFLPETEAYTKRNYHRREKSTIRDVFDEAKMAVNRYWLLLIYLVLLMTGMSYMSHASQDLYATMLLYKYNFQSSEVTMVLVVANFGAILGGVTMGYFSQVIGRRFSIVFLCFVGGALLYPYTFTSGPRIYAAVFFEQFCIQGAFGIIPIHLIELSPVAFRTFVVGTSYQSGVLMACASNTILTSIAEHYPLSTRIVGGQAIVVDDYGLVMCIFLSCTFFYVVIAVILGPEKRRRGMAIEDGTEQLPGHVEYGLSIQRNRDMILTPV